MDEDSSGKKVLAWGLGVVGLGAVASAIAIPKIGIWVALLIIVLALLLFGGFFLWQRMRARRQSRQLSSSLEAQTSAVPKSVSDPEQRARLDGLRQKFQKGLQEFKSRGKDIYKLPWFVIIGESGSGKSEAIRHSGIDFPPGMQDELQGSGGTINMDWWFTNRGIIIDTAGKMIIPDDAGDDQKGEWKPAREWLEFLRLLRKSRPLCPINGLLLVLSTESLIKDSADKIARKAGRLAQQLDKIQREMDVRFPVYLLVTKCDLLEGFREFSDSITDPLLQHQMFGWSNPDPLDAPFRPDLVEQYLASVAERVRRRRLALLREGLGTRIGETQVFFGAGYQKAGGRPRRLDEVDSMFALPQSLMLLAPRLRRYLETIFVAGEWSAKPVFLRGIYFTSSMREGSALDEAVALATGLPLEQLPESRSWESRAFFLRDMFHEKVFREYGLVTRATNTLKMLRQRQLAIFGTASVLLLLLLGFSWFSFRKLQAGVLKETRYWQAATNGWDHGIWTKGAIVSGSAPYQYQGANPLLDTNVVGYQQQLVTIIKEGLPVGLVFKPLAEFSKVKNRPEAQRLVFEGGVINPLVEETRVKMANSDKPSTNAIAAHQNALLALIHLEADGIHNRGLDSNDAPFYLKSFLTYLTATNQEPNPNLVNILLWTYAPQETNVNGGVWPPRGLYGTTDATIAITNGLIKFHLVSQDAQKAVADQLDQLTELAANLVSYQAAEMAWLTNHALQAGAARDACSEIHSLQQSKSQVDAALARSNLSGQVTNLDLRFDDFQKTMSGSSEAAIAGPVHDIIGKLSPTEQMSPIFLQITGLIKGFTQEASRMVEDKRAAFAGKTQSLNADYLALSSRETPIYKDRWVLYSNACDLASTTIVPSDDDIGSGWTRYKDASKQANKFLDELRAYQSSLSNYVSRACGNIAQQSVEQLQNGYVNAYIQLAGNKLAEVSRPARWDMAALKNASNWISRIEFDSKRVLELGGDPKRLDPIPARLRETKQQVIQGITADIEKNGTRFPVCLSSTSVMTAPELSQFRDLLQESSLQTNSPIWNDDASDAIAKLREDCKRYGAVVSSLVNDDGTLADWKISFLVLQQGDPDYARNIDILRVYRYAKISLGERNETDYHDLQSQDKLPPLKGSVSAPLEISICDYYDRPVNQRKTSETKFSDWGFVKLATKASAKDRGWRVEIPLKEGATSGNAVFLIEPARDNQTLPDPQDWLKLCAQPQ